MPKVRRRILILNWKSTEKLIVDQTMATITVHDTSSKMMEIKKPSVTNHVIINK